MCWIALWTNLFYKGSKILLLVSIRQDCHLEGQKGTMAAIPKKIVTKKHIFSNEQRMRIILMIYFVPATKALQRN